jgi:hypothetical protein
MHKSPQYARARRKQRSDYHGEPIHRIAAHRAQLFGAQDQRMRAARARPTVLPDVSAPSIALDAIPPLSEPSSVFSVIAAASPRDAVFRRPSAPASTIASPTMGISSIGHFAQTVDRIRQTTSSGKNKARINENQNTPTKQDQVRPAVIATTFTRSP